MRKETDEEYCSRRAKDCVLSTTRYPDFNASIRYLDAIRNGPYERWRVRTEDSDRVLPDLGKIVVFVIVMLAITAWLST